MPVYCAYIGGLHGRTLGVVQVDFITDESAFKSARRLVDSHDVELWQTDRPVARFDARSKQTCKKIVPAMSSQARRCYACRDSDPSRGRPFRGPASISRSSSALRQVSASGA